jgi:hypothetical protein
MLRAASDPHPGLGENAGDRGREARSGADDQRNFVL